MRASPQHRRASVTPNRIGNCFSPISKAQPGDKAAEHRIGRELDDARKAGNAEQDLPERDQQHEDRIGREHHGGVAVRRRRARRAPKLACRKPIGLVGMLVTKDDVRAKAATMPPKTAQVSPAIAPCAAYSGAKRPIGEHAGGNADRQRYAGDGEPGADLARHRGETACGRPCETRSCRRGRGRRSLGHGVQFPSARRLPHDSCKPPVIARAGSGGHRRGELVLHFRIIGTVLCSAANASSRSGSQPPREKRQIWQRFRLACFSSRESPPPTATAPRMGRIKACMAMMESRVDAAWRRWHSRV